MSWRRAGCLGLLLVGLLSLGQGSYIYAKAALAQVLLRRAWAATESGEQQARPWPWADTWPVARLLSSRHEVDLIVLEGATGNSTAFAPGHVQGSAAPGASGNVALAAHRDTHFSFLRDVQRGDELLLELPDGGVQRYEVRTLSIVHERDTRLLETPGSWLTLVTCYPFDALVPGGPKRWVVQAALQPAGPFCSRSGQRHQIRGCGSARAGRRWSTSSPGGWLQPQNRPSAIAPSSLGPARGASKK